MIPKIENSVARPYQTASARHAVWQGMQTLTDGTDTAPVAGTRYWSSINIAAQATLTGLSFLVGSVGGTDKVIVELHDSFGQVVATSAVAGVTVAATGTIQQVPFLNKTSIIGPGLYYIVVQFNGTTARYRSLAAGTTASQVVSTGSSAGAFGTTAVIAPAQTFTAGVGPVAFTY